MNFVRKHAKVEPARWYYRADRLGLLVWRDMPSLYVSLAVPVGRAPIRRPRPRRTSSANCRRRSTNSAA